ncbi:hypothetical protein PHYBOEH_003384 [Phytophthora boehmeriae]|uniref:RxLR effector protein n=1 Tax=Phytophthora boehmeriae TaxID=109152 RepID=A0A8T1WQD5_9STRA|nr:hypothetical protein PHYBOEH_003384 [Phytophthora boehmeriae]
MRLGQIALAATVALLVSGDNIAKGSSTNYNTLEATAPSRSVDSVGVENLETARNSPELSGSNEERIASIGGGRTGVGVPITTVTESPAPGYTVSEEGTPLSKRIADWWKRVFDQIARANTTNTRRLRLEN